MRRAIHALKNGPPGPVVVELTADVLGQEIPEKAHTYQSPRTAANQPGRGDVQDAAKALLEAKNPVLWAGQGVLFSGATEQLKALAELVGAPVFCTMPGKSAMDERHPLARGAGSGLTTMAARGKGAQWLMMSKNRPSRRAILPACSPASPASGSFASTSSM